MKFYIVYLPFQELLDAASDVMSDWLDKHHGAEVTDNKIFDDLPKLYEDKFHQDMAALNVRYLALSFVWNMFVVLLDCICIVKRTIRFVCCCLQNRCNWRQWRV